MGSTGFNPWQVESLEAFSFLCCPECTFNSKEEELFKDHAIQNHPQSITFFSDSDSLITVKNEPTEDNTISESLVRHVMMMQTNPEGRLLYLNVNHTARTSMIGTQHER